MAFLVGVNLQRTRPVTPTRRVQRLRSAVARNWAAFRQRMEGVPAPRTA